MKFLLFCYTGHVKFSLKSVNLCKFTTWCTDVLADKPHPQFDTKLLNEKVRLIRWCLRYTKIITNLSVGESGGYLPRRFVAR